MPNAQCLAYIAQSGDRRYLYHQGNEQTTWRRSEGGRQALVNTCGKYIPADRPQRSTAPRRGSPPRLVREVAAIWGGPLWVVCGQIYGFTNTCVCINYNSSLTDLLRDHDVQLA